MLLRGKILIQCLLRILILGDGQYNDKTIFEACLKLSKDHIYLKRLAASIAEMLSKQKTLT